MWYVLHAWTGYKGFVGAALTRVGVALLMLLLLLLLLPAGVLSRCMCACCS